MKEKLLTIMFSIFCLTTAGQNNQNNSTILGDTNGDGVINEEDISELEKNILGIHSDLFIKNNADVNHDEAINVADIVGLVNIYKNLNYRIYEFNYENERIKKIYLDNAGMLCSSATGEFGANDTIQFMSSNSSPLLLTTDDNGNLESIYIEDHLLHFYYDDNGDADIIEISKSDITIHQVTNLIDNRVQSTRGLAKQLYSKAFKGMKKFQDFLKTKEGKELIYKAQIELLSPLLEKYVYSDLTQLVDEINNNPDFHYLRLIRDGLIIVDDIASIAGLVGVTIASDGAALPISGPLLLFTLDGYNKHFEEFLNELIPDSDRMKKYADYYKKKYGINLSIFDPDNISPQKLTLHGGLLTQDGQNGENRKGNAYFYYWVMGNESRYKEEAKYKELSVGTYQLSLEIPVESGTDYFASIIYEIKIKGLNLKISSETITFKTPYELSPTIMDFKQTGSEYKKDAFTNNDKKYSYKFNCATTADIEMLFDVEDWGYIYIDPDDGKKRISLMEFGTNYTDTRYAYYRNEPKSTVTFQPYVKYKVETEKVSSTRGTNEGDEDGYWYGEPVNFDLIYNEPQLCPDDNHPHMIDLGLPSGTKWACCNVGASNPEDYGGFYTIGEAFEKDVYSYVNYPYYDINLGSDISGTAYDVAHVLWGENWKTPSREQLQELIDYTTFKEFTKNGVWGGLFTSSTGMSIFIPAAGYKLAILFDGNGNIIKEYYNEGQKAAYWSSTQCAHREGDTDSMYEMYFSREYDSVISLPAIDAANNFWGMPVRPVAK